MTHPVLDWRPHFDPRSVPHRFSATPFCDNLARRNKIKRTKTVWLDQQSEGACTGFGAEHVLATTPYPMPTSDDLARLVYYEARRQDEWEGEGYEGSSVNGAMRAERKMGRIKAWRWAYSLEEADHGLSYHGAGEAGTWWYSGMWDTDSNGFIHPTGTKVGGHAYSVSSFGWLNGGKWYQIDNSWGPGWGVNGSARIWAADMEMLLRDEGEWAFPVRSRDANPQSS